ncbi:MAG: hypothetical protein PHF86_08505 [Candidatus Nanoarchaeia archaeon]|nr:hypothetical protein [Candidatus Nanoarchaeia archaeon]
MENKVLFYDNESKCDICDSKNNLTVHIEDIIGNVHIFCIDCLIKIINNSPKNKIKTIKKF